MKLLSRDQSRYLDHYAIHELKISGIELMNAAGKAISDLIIELSDKKPQNTAILCGKGNNGGDGFAAALWLLKAGFEPDIYVLGDREGIKGDAEHFYMSCINENITIHDSAKLPDNVEYSFIVDAFLGTGFTGDLPFSAKKWFFWANTSNATIIAADVPSGLNSDTGVCSEGAIQADYTVTMGECKLGLKIGEGKENSGEIIVADIGFPENIEYEGIIWEESDISLISHALLKPKFNAHKYLMGKVLVIGGSTGMTGAAVLASKAALRGGAGIVKCVVPSSLNHIFETLMTEVMTIPVKDEENGFLSDNNFPEIEEHLDWCDALVIGPGLGREKSTGKLIEKVLTDFHKPAVIDADALYFYDQNKENHILTPHEGELNRLEGNGDTRLSRIIEFMKSFMGILVQKGAPTFICKGRNGAVNISGNQGMATAGSGDVLSGIIAGFAAQGMDSLTASIAGVYIHGHAADLLISEKGYRGITATDILEKIPSAISEFEL